MTVQAKKAVVRRKSANSWKHFRVQSAKSHVVHETLQKDIVEDLWNRKHEVQEQNDVVYHAVDFGGMCMVDMPRTSYRIDGIKIEIMCNQVPELYAVTQALLQKPARISLSGKPFIKLHGKWQSIVLNPEQLQKLDNAVKRSVKLSKKRVAKFFVAWEARRVRKLH